MNISIIILQPPRLWNPRNSTYIINTYVNERGQDTCISLFAWPWQYKKNGNKWVTWFQCRVFTLIIVGKCLLSWSANTSQTRWSRSCPQGNILSRRGSLTTWQVAPLMLFCRCSVDLLGELILALSQRKLLIYRKIADILSTTFF